MTNLSQRLSTEADQCRNDGADDIAALLDEAVRALTPSTDAARLLPCPFCEGHAIEDCEADADYPSKKFMFVRCCRCGVKTSAIYGSGDPSEWADARHNWNRRATTDRGALPDKARDAAIDNSRCKFAAGGACCVSHCGDPDCAAMATKTQEG